jgi:mono/diheme cytochrome c family protein
MQYSPSRPRQLTKLVRRHLPWFSLATLACAGFACGSGELGSGGSPFTNTPPPAPAPAPTTSSPAPTPAPSGGSIDNPGPVTPPTPTPQPPTAMPTTPPPEMGGAPTPPAALPMPGVPTLPNPKIIVSEIEMPGGVRQILERRCSACHTYGERDPIGWGSVLDLSRMISADIIVPGNPDTSRLWNRVAVRADMPYNGQRLSGPEVQVLRAWMANLNRPTQKPRSHEDLLDLIAADQAKLKAAANDYRYISFAHFADERRAPEEMQSAASVLGVVLNSLSRKATIVRPVAADPGQVLYRFRLSDYGWGREEWDRLVSFYPYCLRSDKAPHRAVYDRLQTEAPYLRGDWFLATATKPPLYEELLDIPATLQELEDDLGLDIEANLNRQKPDAIRIGFRSSGVSAHNRLIERHKLRNGGSFWISYDFNADEDRADLRENPLGPRRLNIKNFEKAFEHAGGEVIYSLPNGLFGYLLVDAAGTRINQAPKEIVKDPRRRPGAVENGISCIGCHGVTGMNKPRIFDEILKYAEEHKNNFPRRELDEIRALYPSNGDQILSEDAARYLKAMEAAGGQRVDPGTIEYDAFINLVGEYEAKVGLRSGAMELGLEVEAARALVQKGRNEDALPITLADPLVTRDDFVCRLRRIVPSVGTRPQFCRGSFTDDEARRICD